MNWFQGPVLPYTPVCLIFLETIHVTENLKTYQIMYLFYGD